MGGPERGYDGGKRVKGRKRHIAVDTAGLLLGVLVHSASVNDSQQMPHLLRRIVGKVPRMKTVFADQGYRGTPGGLVWRCFGWRCFGWLLKLVKREEDQKGFAVQEKRWVVERTFS